MEATVWSWATDRPETGFASPRAVVVSSDGRWTDTNSDAGEGEIHSYACRNEGTCVCVQWVICVEGLYRVGWLLEGGGGEDERVRTVRIDIYFESYNFVGGYVALWL